MMPSFEKLGLFYLGKIFDPQTHSRTHADGYSETSWTSIPIDRGQFFQMMVDRASDTMVTT